MTRRDLVWAAAYGATFALRLEPLVDLDVSHVDEAEQLVVRKFVVSPSRLAHIDAAARAVADHAASSVDPVPQEKVHEG